MVDVSIIIPVYGVEKYIEQFMESLISQTKQNFIAIFVNDKTEDNSINIVKKYSDFFVD
ncbi:MAG: glycosyltransferase, partial [Butyrivibrio sp.]|nr:glycosyltransferase [Butyrivibrio sp.]